MRLKLKEKTKKRITWCGWLLFYLYIILLCYFLFLSEHYGRDILSKEYRYNLEFFKEIKRFIKYRERLGFENFAVNILGNILAFAPFGFLLPMLKKSYRHFFVIAPLSALFSLSIELVQLYTRVGIFDVDDILLNSIGGILGYLAFTILHFIFRRKHKETNVKKGD
ncbi:MAG TPA: VanZ family protein [Lachnospiraceae bacterium]|nr:VanZ family protein [Lachnospiraceae bacterium]